MDPVMLPKEYTSSWDQSQVFWIGTDKMTYLGSVTVTVLNSAW